MQIIQEEITKQENFTQEQKTEIATVIRQNFITWNQDRQEQITDAQKIMKEVYLHQSSRYKDESDSWKSDVSLNKLYSIKRAKKAQLWRELWSNPASMFDVKGTNEFTKANEENQKEAICKSLTDMNVSKELDTGAVNILDIGEAVFITDWEERQKVVKRKTKEGFIAKTISTILNVPTNDTNQKIEIPYYRNARVKAISPLMFVFDAPNLELNNKQSWDKCTKIYKRFETIDAIKSNKLYKLTEEELNSITVKSDNNEETKTDDLLIEELQYGNKYEVLYVHGDININGKIYKNYIAEVLNGNILLRFEENPMLINPFVYGALEIDPYTKRGMSPLKAPYELSKMQEDLTNRTVDMQELALNPPTWVNEQLVDKNLTELKLKPGKMLKYKESYNGSMPTPVTLNANTFNSTLSLTEKSIEDMSAVNSNNFGNVNSTKRTATELSLADKGSTSQTSYDLDIINQNIILPIIENVAELLAMFLDGDEVLYVENKGKSHEIKITNEIRQAFYKYTYEDRNAVIDQKQKFTELFGLFQNIAQDPELRQMVNWRECITTAVESVGYDDSENFLMPDDELTQAYNMLKQAPQEIQQIMLGQLKQTYQQIMMMMQQRQQQAQNPQQAQMRQQAQMQMQAQQQPPQLPMQ